MRLLLLAACLVLDCTVLFADQIVLMNGDTLTASIVKKDGDKLTVKSEFLGEVTMPWSAVRTLRSDAAVTVVLPTGDSVQGKLETQGPDLEVATPAGQRSAPLAAVTAIRNDTEQAAYERLQHPGLLELWTGYFDLGFALTRGNSRNRTLTTAFNASRITRTSKLTAYMNEIYAASRVNGLDSTTANAIRGGWSYNHDIRPRLFLTAFNDYEHDQFQDLDLRFVLGGGAGYSVIKRGDNVRLDVLGGADYNHENFGSGLTRNFAEANMGDDLLYKISGITTLNQSFRFFANLTDTGEYRINFDLSTATTLKKWLSWQVTASSRFLSNPLPGRQRNDLLLSTGFRFTFAR
jgi:hypothetical protein